MPPPTIDWQTAHTREYAIRQIWRHVAASSALLAAGALAVLGSDVWWLETLGVLCAAAAVLVAGLSRPWRPIHTEIVLDPGKPHS